MSKNLMSLLMFVAAVSPSAWAEPGPDDPGGPPPDGDKRIVEQLNLSHDQVEKLRKIHEEGREKFAKQRDEFQKQREKVRSAHDKLNEALRGSASEKELRDLFAELQSARKSMLGNAAFEGARFEEVLKIRAILTPEQRQKFEGLPRPGPRFGRGAGRFGEGIGRESPNR